MKMLMEKVLAVAMIVVGPVAFAKPSVEITKLTFADPLSGKASLSYSYKVEGIEGDACYDLSFKISAKGATPATIGIWNVANGAGTTNIDYQVLLGKCHPNVSVFAKLVTSRPAVQLWENGPFWATCNIGAEEPEEYGYYFWWGDTVGYVYNGNQWNAVDGSKTGYWFSSENCPTYNKTPDQLYDEGYIDANNADGKLKPEYDAAKAHCGGDWRMPTLAEIKALLDKCEWEWKPLNNVNGYIVKGKGDYGRRYMRCKGG